MQTLIDKFGTNATYVIAAVGALILLLVLVLLARAVFAGRIRMSSGRARQPRLGVVDAFDLDRQRQLVLVRRDNVEHLVMIGGPNDVVIESTIVRSAAASEVRPRTAPVFEEPASAPAAAPAVRTAAPPSIDDLVQAVAPPQPAPKPAPAPAPVPRLEPAPPPRPAPVTPARPAPVPPPPPPPPPVLTVPPPPPAPPPTVAPPPTAAPSPEEPPKKRFDFGRLMASRSTEPPKSADVASPAPVQVPRSAAPSAGVSTAGAAVAAAPAAPASSAPTAVPAAATAGDPIDALEQEMAKLLGRPSSGS